MKSKSKIGAGNHNLTVTLTVEESDAFAALAKQSGMSRNKYVRHILLEALSRPPRIDTTTIISSKCATDYPQEIRAILQKVASKAKASRS